MAPTSYNKSIKIEPRAAHGRLIHRFVRFMSVLKNRRFFDAALGRPKIDKFEPWGAQGPHFPPAAFAKAVTLGPRGPWAARARFY